MDQEKIGKFILNRRNKLKLTQQELADKIGVTDKAISKWERGKGMPDYSLFIPLCNALGISVNELLSGEKNIKSDQVVSDYLVKESKKNKKKIISLLFVSLLIIIVMILGIFFINNHKNITVYEIEGKGNYFVYKNSALIISNIKNVLIPGDLDDNFVTNKDKIVISQTLVVGKNNRIIYENNTGEIISEKYGEEIIFDKELLDGLYTDLRLIVYFMVGNSVYKDEIKLELVKSFTNDKIINKKSTSTKEKKVKYFEEKNYDKTALYKEFLEKEGFVKTSNVLGLKMNIKEHSLVKFISDKEAIVVNYLSHYVRYYYHDSEKSIHYRSPHFDYDDALDVSHNWFSMTFKDENGSYGACYDFNNDMVSCFKNDEAKKKYSKKLIEIAELFDKYNYYKISLG